MKYVARDNKLIAEFMGYTHQSDRAFKDENGFTNDFEVFETWDWLMPVIIKIADIRKDTHYKLYKTINEAHKEVEEFHEIIEKTF